MNETNPDHDDGYQTPDEIVFVKHVVNLVSPEKEIIDLVSPVKTVDQKASPAVMGSPLQAHEHMAVTDGGCKVVCRGPCFNHLFSGMLLSGPKIGKKYFRCQVCGKLYIQTGSRIVAHSAT